MSHVPPTRAPREPAPAGDVVRATAPSAGDLAVGRPTVAGGPVPAAPPGTLPGSPGSVAFTALSRRGSRLPWALALGGYTVLVALVVGWPTPVDAAAQDGLASVFARLHAAGVPAWVDYAFAERAANVAMFVPFGLLITGLDRRRWWWGLLVPAALSAAAEVGQLLLRPERFATWSDVAANTAGAALGVVVALVLTARGRPARTASRRRP